MSETRVNPYRDDDAKTFTLPVSGSVVLYGPEIEIIATPEFQRLAGIRQLGTAYLVYRGATHTRFEHSLGTLHRAEQLIRAVNENPRSDASIDRAGRRLTRLASLLHDLPHIPFGHTLEDEFGLLERHDRNGLRIRAFLEESRIAEILRAGLGDHVREAQAEYQELLDIMSAKKDEDVAALTRPYIADIVGNTVCADALDYLERDLAMCGMPGAIGTRFLDFFTITPQTATRPVDRGRMALRLDKRGMPRPDVESEVVKLLTYRYELAERVYFHHAKNCASTMIGRAVVAAGLLPDTPNAAESADPEYDRNFWWLSDDLLLHALRKSEIAVALDLKREPRSINDLALAADLAHRVLVRGIYKIAYLAVRDDLPLRADELWAAYGDAAARRTLEDQLAADADLPPGHVLVHLPNPKGLTKLASVRVLTDQDEVLTLDRWDGRHSGRFAAINSAHERLWRVTVYAHPAATPRATALLRTAAQDVFGASSRYRTGPRRSAYLDEVFIQFAAQRGWDMSDREALEQPAAAFGEDLSLDEAIASIEARIMAHRTSKSGNSDASGRGTSTDETP